MRATAGRERAVKERSCVGGRIAGARPPDPKVREAAGKRRRGRCTGPRCVLLYVGRPAGRVKAGQGCTGRAPLGASMLQWPQTASGPPPCPSGRPCHSAHTSRPAHYAQKQVPSMYATPPRPRPFPGRRPLQGGVCGDPATDRLYTAPPCPLLGLPPARASLPPGRPLPCAPSESFPSRPPPLAVPRSRTPPLP